MTEATKSNTDERRPFGELLTAMVTPFADNGGIDITRAGEPPWCR